MDIKKLTEQSKNIKVLYCEDNIEARESTLFLLSEFFNTIVVAVDGEDGYNKFTSDENNFDLIITDINMPKLNGIEMIDKIRDIDTKIPILIFSAHDEHEYIINSIKLFISGFLFKPVEMDKFINIISNITKEFMIKDR